MRVQSHMSDMWWHACYSLISVFSFDIFNEHSVEWRQRAQNEIKNEQRWRESEQQEEKYFRILDRVNQI